MSNSQKDDLEIVHSLRLAEYPEGWCGARRIQPGTPPIIAPRNRTIDPWETDESGFYVNDFRSRHG